MRLLFHILSLYIASVAQLVEHLTCNQGTEGSIPSRGFGVIPVSGPLDAFMIYREPEPRGIPP